jgi:hypothetical protein
MSIRIEHGRRHRQPDQIRGHLGYSECIAGVPVVRLVREHVPRCVSVLVIKGCLVREMINVIPKLNPFLRMASAWEELFVKVALLRSWMTWLLLRPLIYLKRPQRNPDIYDLLRVHGAIQPR